MPLKKRASLVALKRLKDIIRTKGKVFSSLVGIPYDTLRSIECGQRKINLEMAWQVRAATGVTVDSIMPGSKKPLNDSGQTYREHDFHYWRANILRAKDSRYARWQAEEGVKNLQFWTKILFMACTQDPSKSTIHALRMEIAQCLDNLAKGNCLTKAINSILRNHPITDELSMSKAEWKNEPELMTAFKVTDKQLRATAEHDTYVAKRTLFTIWNPSGGVPDTVYQSIMAGASSKVRPAQALPTHGNF